MQLSGNPSQSLSVTLLYEEEGRGGEVGARMEYAIRTEGVRREFYSTSCLTTISAKKVT
jgi:hypothetical protein